jgi:hypothetical protein
LQSSWMSKTYLKSDHFNGGGSGVIHAMEGMISLLYRTVCDYFTLGSRISVYPRPVGAP